jgi:glyoxylase-like metal-dependent hydrolase (beta-lactamase superfamily II)
MIFRQLFDPETSTYTYLLADAVSREAVLIDSVIEQLDRDRALLAELELSLRFAIDTHVHADHVTASGRLREALRCKIAVSAAAGVQDVDLPVCDGDRLRFGAHQLLAIATPGHTSGCMTYVCEEPGLAFTGDALLIRGCGRTDCQQGDARELFRSVHERIFTLPDETLIYPAHDYKGRTVSSVAEEKRFNPRLGLQRCEGGFVQLMARLELAYPRKLAVAVPANLHSGLFTPPPCLEDLLTHGARLAGAVARTMETLGRQDAEMWQDEGI